MPEYTKVLQDTPGPKLDILKRSTQSKPVSTQWKICSGCFAERDPEKDPPGRYCRKCSSPPASAPEPL
jgi:hypothetical protein